MAKRKHPVYKTNPFLDSVILEGKWRSRKIGKDDILFNLEGVPQEAKEHTVNEYKEMQKFIKLYQEGMEAILSLKSAGQKVCKLICRRLYGDEGINNDRVLLKYDLLSKEEQNEVKKSMFFYGINECIELDLIAQSVYPFEYFINPTFIFNGDRFKLNK